MGGDGPLSKIYVEFKRERVIEFRPGLQAKDV